MSMMETDATQSATVGLSAVTQAYIKENRKEIEDIFKEKIRSHEWHAELTCYVCSNGAMYSYLREAVDQMFRSSVAEHIQAYFLA